MLGDRGRWRQKICCGDQVKEEEEEGPLTVAMYFCINLKCKKKKKKNRLSCNDVNHWG